MRTLMCVLTLLLVSSASRQDQAVRGYVPPNGFVPDSATAVRIAVAVWIPIYGMSQIRSEQPYVARLKDGVWTVTETFPHGMNVGGTAEARIAKRDGRILSVIHGL
jgi:NTF2 fold immunity protein of polymorphic toxin system component